MESVLKKMSESVRMLRKRVEYEREGGMHLSAQTNGSSYFSHEIGILYQPMPIYFKFECKSGAVDPEFQRLILVFEITFVNCRFHDGNVRKQAYANRK